MTTLAERYPDLLREPADARAQRLVGDLDAACAATTTPPGLRATIAAALEVPAQASPRRALSSPAPRLRARLASLAAVAALALSGALAYLHLQSPAPASAQSVLQRAVAAATHLAPHEVLHLVYRLTNVVSDTGRFTGTIDVWIQADAHGAPVLLAETQTTRGGDGAVPSVERRVFHGSTGWEYRARDNAIRPVATDAPGPGLFIGGAAYFNAFAQGAQQSARLLPRQTIAGVTCDVVRVDPLYAPSYTLYFDARSAVLRALDVAGGRGGRGLLVAETALPASAVPARTFALNAPATARTASPATADAAATAGLYAVDHTALALVSVCNTPPDALKTAMASGNATPLAICRATAPEMTQAALVAALIAEEKARLGLAEGVALGSLSPDQAAQILANLTTKLTVWVTRPLTD
jgi:hypothetical protein